MKLQWWVPALAVVLGVMGACGSSGNGASAGHADSGTDATTPIADGGTDAGDGGEDAGPPQSIFVVPASVSTLTDVHFFDHPWPSDLPERRQRLHHPLGCLQPVREPVIADYIQAVTGAINGFSTASFGYLRFTADIDPTTLPATPPDTLAATSPSRSSTSTRARPSTISGTSRSSSGSRRSATTGSPTRSPSRRRSATRCLANTKYAIVVTNGVK